MLLITVQGQQLVHACSQSNVFWDHEFNYQASSEPIVYSQSAENKLIGCNLDC